MSVPDLRSHAFCLSFLIIGAAACRTPGDGEGDKYADSGHAGPDDTASDGQGSGVGGGDDGESGGDDGESGDDDDGDDDGDDGDDGECPEDEKISWFEDSDGDGFGDSGSVIEDCEPPGAQWVLAEGDCDDSDAAVNPDASEACNGVDDDCDGGVDEDFDADGDGHFIEDCAGVHDDAGDCDDGDFDINPAAEEVCDDGVDDDCDGVDLECSYTGSYAGSSAHAILYGDAEEGYAAKEGAGVGDVDGDGTLDLVVSATHVNGNEGATYVASGPLSGTAVLSSGVTISNSIADNGRYVGWGLAVGDLDGDGVDDLMLGQPGTTVPSTWLLMGPLTSDTDIDDADWQLVGESSSGFGSRILVEDLDGDGQDDAIVGAYRANDGAGTAAGSVYIGFGPLTGTATPDWPDEADVTLAGESAQGLASYAMDTGDVDGDGVLDLLVGAPYEFTPANYAGAVYLLRGPVTSDLDLDDAFAIRRGASYNMQLGYGVALGDFDGDGLDDLGLGQPGSATAAVAVVLSPVTGDSSLSAPDAGIAPPGVGTSVGATVAAGDVDGDGDAELLVGGSHASSAGRAWLFDGPLSGNLTVSDAVATFNGEGADDLFGYKVWMEDPDDDGLDEVLIGAAFQSTHAADAGALYIFEP